MTNWYSEVKIKGKANTKIKPIYDYMVENYLTNMINNSNIKLDEKKEEMTIYGCEGNTLSSKGDKYTLPLCDELFVDISKKFPSSNYEGYARLENSICCIMEEYFIYYEDGKLRILSPEPYEVISFEWDNYNDFLNDFCYDNNLTEEKFIEYKKDKEDVLYHSESGYIYSKREYYDTKKEIFTLNINDNSKESILNNINENNVRKIFLALTDEQKKDRDIVLKVIKASPSYFKEINKEFLKDKEIVYNIIKECIYFWNDICKINSDLKKDEFLCSIYKKLQKIENDTQKAYGEIFELKLPKIDEKINIKIIGEEFEKKFNKYIERLENSKEFKEWLKNG